MPVFDQLPTDPRLAQKIVQEEFRDIQRSREMGRLGGWLGSRENASTYIAGILAVFFALCLCALVFAPIGSGIERKDALQLFGGFFLAALGYLFGSLTGGGSN
jgi:hypothetical protein